MGNQHVIERLAEHGVVPVVAIDHVETALPLADALLEGGLAVVEITFRTEAAAKVIEKLTQQRGDLLVGAGTILNIENLKRARDCGAVFGVAPGFNPTVVTKALELDFPFFPGVLTPTDVEAAIGMGLNILKFFPAEASGGIKMIKALSGPYGHTGVKFIPTGGINAENFRDYLALNCVLAVGGSWVAKRSDIAEGNWERIKANCLAIRDSLSS